LTSAVVTSLFGGIPFGVAQKQASAAAYALREHGILCEEEHLPLPTTRSSGSALFICLQFEHTAAGFTELGERQLSPEAVGRAAASQVAAFMESAGAVEEHLADQLLLPAALLAAGRVGEVGISRFRSAGVTAHLTQSAAVIERFLPVRVGVGDGGEVEVKPA
jgi:RNA 3'-terminal phosphate cyclase (ATP)